ncbi:universal stress protein [Solibacillus silvestris]|uniref:universal stress protein n=1 Tax=Solibacillus silvestris TaxID=76853 RepID=UPI003F7E06F5
MANHYKNIVVAVDGSDLGELAFRKAIDVAKRNVDSTLHIIHVIDTSISTSFDMLYDNMVELIRKHGEVLLDRYELEANEAGIHNVNKILAKGTPKVVLAKKLSDYVKADIIICGATGLNAMEQIFIGSNTEAIVRHSKCDVLIVRTPEQ